MTQTLPEGAVVGSVWGMSIAVIFFGVRGAAVLIYSLATTMRQMLTERSRRATLLAAARAVPQGGVLVDERSDGSKITIRTGRTYR